MYVVYTFGSLSASWAAKGAAVCFCDPALRWRIELTGGFIKCAASYMFVPHSTRAFHSLVHADMSIIRVRYALRVFTKDFKWHIPSKQQRSALPNGKSIRTNQVPNLGGDQAMGQTMILNPLSVFRGSVPPALPRGEKLVNPSGRKEAEALGPSVELRGPRTPTMKATRPPGRGRHRHGGYGLRFTSRSWVIGERCR